MIVCPAIAPDVADTLLETPIDVVVTVATIVPVDVDPMFPRISTVFVAPGASVKSTEIVFDACGWIGFDPDPEVSEVLTLWRFARVCAPVNPSATCNDVTRTDSDELWFWNTNEPIFASLVFGLIDCAEYPGFAATPRRPVCTVRVVPVTAGVERVANEFCPCAFDDPTTRLASTVPAV